MSRSSKGIRRIQICVSSDLYKEVEEFGVAHFLSDTDAVKRLLIDALRTRRRSEARRLACEQTALEALREARLRESAARPARSAGAPSPP